MLRALFSGVSGLNQNIVKLDVIGNNIANVNTVGFKSARVSFGDAFSQTLRGGTISRVNRGGVNPIQVGSGVQIHSISSLFNQGNIQTTGGVNDLAVQGEGFFIVNDGQENFYTRAGSFEVDSFGRVVQGGTGYIVQGYAYDNATNVRSTTLGSLEIPFGKTVPARSTSEIDFQGNLPLDSDGRATVMATGGLEDAAGAPATGTTLLTDLRQPNGSTQLLFAGDNITLDGAVGDTTSTATMSVTPLTTLNDLLAFVETNLGVPAGNVTVTPEGGIRVEGDEDMGTDGSISLLRLTADDGAGTNRTDFNISTSFAQLQESRDALQVVQESVVYDALGVAHNLQVTFTRENGELAWTWQAEMDGDASGIVSGQSGRVSYLDDGTLGSFTFDDGSGELTFDPGTGATSPQTVQLDPGSLGDPGGMTMLSAPTSLETIQDGFPTGAFLDYSIDGSGRIFALFSNGETEVVGDLALGRFNNPTSLTKDGDNLYRTSSNSGKASVRPAGDATGVRIVVGALEQSNVDLAREFSELIITQRAFQANARVIQSSSEILAELMQLNR